MYFEAPPQMASPELYSYLYRLSEALNVALTQVEQQISTESKAAAMEAAGGAGNSQSESAESLKALIVNTAEIVRTEMDVMQTELHGQYTALSSQFGAYEKNLSATITATAEGILQQYGYDSRLDALDNKAAGFERYQIHTEGFIRQGFIDYDASGAPVIGIAIGQNLRSTTVTIEGQELEQLDSAQSCAFYTADRVSFRIGGNEVAYVSNRKLYILAAQITGSLTIGEWLFTHDDISGLVVRYTGG